VNVLVKTPKLVILTLLVDSGATKLHSVGGRVVLQFRRSKVPGINVVLSGVRVNAPSDPVK